MEDQHIPSNSKITPRLVLTIIGAVAGSFQFGYNVGVINAPETLIKSFMNETYFDRNGSPMSDETRRNMWALTASIFSVGGCLGGFLAGWWATRFGRKGGSLMNIVFGVVASILMFTCRKAASYEMIIIGRILIGFHSGLYTGLSPMYLSEISTRTMRGAIGVLHQLGVVIAIFLSQVLGFPDLLGTAENWNILLGLAILPCVVQAVTLPFCPESPRYLLITKQNEKECRKALIALRGTEEIEDEVNEIKQEMMSCCEKTSIIQLFRSPSLRPPLIIGIVMHLSQQLSGVNGVFFYSTNLFNEAIGSETIAKYATSAVGGIMVVMTLVSIPLMDRLGRRTLHLFGLAGMTVFSVMVTVTLALRSEVHWFGVASIVCVLVYMVFFAVGPGSIPWLIVSELFSHDARPSAISVCVLVNWLASFVVGFVFPSLQDGLRDYTFLPFSVLLVLFCLFTFFYVPETKGKTFEEVTAIWQKVPGDDERSSKNKSDENDERSSKNKSDKNDERSSKNKSDDQNDEANNARKPSYGSTNAVFTHDSETSLVNNTKF